MDTKRTNECDVRRTKAREERQPLLDRVAGIMAQGRIVEQAMGRLRLLFEVD